MSCYHPNGMIVIDNPSKTDKIVLKNNGFNITNDGLKATRFISKLPDNLEKHVDEFCRSLIPSHCSNSNYEFMQIPCGCCIGCRLDYSKYWASRCFGESQYHTDNYFVTLTYDDDHLKIGNLGNATLFKEDLQKFIKALRNYGYKDLRYFACGEYGDSSFRPHYHVILYNCPLPDLIKEIPYAKNGLSYTTSKADANGDSFFYSSIIHNAWHKKGNILIGRCTYESCAYVARYVVKKSKGVNSKFYENLEITPEFVLMSRRPGIGHQYIMDHYDELKDSPALFIPGKSPFMSGFGKYFTKVQKSFNNGDYENRINVVKARSSSDLIFRRSISSKTIKSQYQDSEQALVQKVSILKRNKIDDLI